MPTSKQAKGAIPNAKDLLSLHDAELITIDVDTAGRALSLRFKRSGGTLVDFSFEHVRHLRISGVFLQNVASRVS